MNPYSNTNGAEIATMLMRYLEKAIMGWNGLIVIVNPELRLNNLGFASYVNLF